MPIGFKCNLYIFSKIVLVRVLQRNSTNRKCVCVCVRTQTHTKIETYYKEQAHTALESDKSRSAVNWQAGDSGILMYSAQLNLKALEQGELMCSSNTNTSRLKTQEKLIFPFESKGMKKLVSKFEGDQARGILSGQPFSSSWAFKWLGEAQPCQQCNPLYSVYQFKYESHSKTPSQECSE